MLRKQINDLNQNDIKVVKIVSIFALQAYWKPWFTACNAPSAPRTDLTLLEPLRKYRHSVGRVAAAKLEGHLWYLSPELVLLALFDNLVSPNSKWSMVQAMQKKEEHKPRKVKAALKKETLQTLDTLTTPVSRNLLHQLHLG